MNDKLYAYLSYKVDLCEDCADFHNKTIKFK